MPSLSRNNAAMRLPSLIDGVPMCVRVRLGFNFGVFVRRVDGRLLVMVVFAKFR